MNDKQLDLNEVFDQLFDHSFKKTHKTAEDTAIQQVINEQLLYNIFHLLMSKEVYPQVKAVGMHKLKEIRPYLESNTSKGETGAMNAYWSETIAKFLKSPSKDYIKASPKIPDGSPIGMH